jgi:tetratricopeptide (TPR) repeat protein
MRRILFLALLAIIASAPLLSAQDPAAQDPDTALATLSDLSHRGQLPQLIDAANSILATGKLTPADQGMVFLYLGYAWQQRGDFTKATASYEKALAVVNRDGQHPSDYAAILATFATVYANTAQFDTAKHMLLRSIHLFENETNHTGAAVGWNDLATIAAEQHSRRDAHKYMARSLAESQLARDITPAELAALATTQGRIAELDNDPRTAISDYQHAFDLLKQTHRDQQQKTAWLYVLLGGAYLQAGDIANARENTSRGIALLQATSGTETPRYFAAQLAYSKVLDASGAHGEASSLRKQAQAAMTTGTDRQRAKSTISVNALR